MENMEFEGKKLELLSEEELLKICGGNEINPEIMINAKKAMCKSATDIKECDKWDFCVWKVSPTTHYIGTCHYKG